MPRTLRVERALQVIPDVEVLLPLRSELVRASRLDEQRRWAGSEAYALVDTRVVDPDSLDAAVTALTETLRNRVEEIYREVIEATRRVAAGEWTDAAFALVAAGDLQEEAGHLASAERFFEKALELGRKARDRRGEILARRRLGRAARGRGALTEARAFYRGSFDLAVAQGDTEGMVVACQGIGNVLVDLGEWSESASWFERGLAILGERPSSRLWQLQVNLSNASRRKGDLDIAARWLSLARETASDLNDSAADVFLLNAAGLMDMARGDPEAAETRFQEALDVASSPAERSTVLVNLAECLLELGRPRDSESVARDLERIVTVHSLETFLPYVYRALGAVAGSRRDEDGFVFFEQALHLCAVLGAPPLEVALTQHAYAKFEAAIGRRDAAASRFEEADRLYREIGSTAERDRLFLDRSRVIEPDGPGEGSDDAAEIP